MLISRACIGARYRVVLDFATSVIYIFTRAMYIFMQFALVDISFPAFPERIVRFAPEIATRQLRAGIETMGIITAGQLPRYSGLSQRRSRDESANCNLVPPRLDFFFRPVYTP